MLRTLKISNTYLSSVWYIEFKIHFLRFDQVCNNYGQSKQNKKVNAEVKTT